MSVPSEMCKFRVPKEQIDGRNAFHFGPTGNRLIVAMSTNTDDAACTAPGSEDFPWCIRPNYINPETTEEKGAI
jgi:hypothetical protein